MKRHAWPFLPLLCAGLLAVWSLPCWTPPAFAEKLPVFKLHAPNVNRAQADTMLNDLHKGKPPGPPEQADRADAIVSRSGKKLVEVNKASGAIFASDAERLWNPHHKPTLPSQQEAKSRADNFLSKHKLSLSAQDKHASAKFDGYSETKALSSAPGSTPVVLDTQVNYKMEVKVKRGGRDTTLPVVGGGGKLKVNVGDRGDVVGFHGNMRKIDRVESEEEILPQGEAEKQFRQAHQNLNLGRVSSSLAYYAAPPGEQQTHMAPVWVVNATTKMGDQDVPMRSQIIPATKYGPKPAAEPPAGPRDPGQKPPAGDSDEKGPPQKGSNDLLDWLFRPAWAQDAFNEIGVHYIGVSGGLAQSANNAFGFRNRMVGAGWRLNFIWGDANAWEADWARDNKTMVDAVDLMFYTGHAGPQGWSLHTPEAGSLYYTKVNAMYPELWGNDDLEWIIIAACGPLQHPTFMANTNSAFDRWGKAFNGLHILMGYGAGTFDQPYEGNRFAELALSGKPIIDAWFQTGIEIQPSTNGMSPPFGPRVYVAAMWAELAPNTTRWDRIWGRGYVSPDPVGPAKQLWLMWSGT